MKIVLVSPVPPPAGGIASWTKMYLDSEFAKKNDVVLVNTAVQGKRIQDLTKRSLFSELKRTYGILHNLKSVLKRNDVDILHLNSPCSKTGLLRDYLCFRIAKKYHCKKVVHFRCDVSFMVKGKLSLFLFKKICFISDKILVLNTISKNFILSQTNLESEFIPNFISEDMIDTRTRKEINDTAKKILYAGHITDSKGCGIIYDVANECKEYEFLLAGYVSESFKMKKLPSNIKLLGEKSHEVVLDLMKDADAFLFLSYSEGFPNVISEAMGIGLPIIATAVGAIPDMLEDKGGIIVPPGDKEACLQALNDIQSKEKREQFSRWNQNKAETTYFKSQVFKQLEHIYKNI